MEREKNAKKLQQADYNQEQLMKYFAFRGQIFIQLQDFEKAYFSFAKALSFSGVTTKVNMTQNTPDIQ